MTDTTNEKRNNQKQETRHRYFLILLSVIYFLQIIQKNT